jgi:hypothetical protein
MHTEKSIESIMFGPEILCPLTPDGNYEIAALSRQGGIARNDDDPTGCYLKA